MTHPHERALEAALKAGIQAYNEAIAPCEVKFYFMFDGHAFARIKGDTLDAIIDRARELNADPEYGSYGMLCPVIKLRGDEEVYPRIGKGVHFKQRGDQGDPVAIAAWKAACEADADIVAHLAPPAAQEKK